MTPWIILVLAVVCAGLAVSIWSWWQMFGGWKLLHPWNSGVQYKVSGLESATAQEDIYDALSFALAQLWWEHGRNQYNAWRWLAINLPEISKLKIYVRSTPAWSDGGRKVAGILNGNVITVGSDLAALCHELAHFLRRELDGVDLQAADALPLAEQHEHLFWQTNGIQTAIDNYTVWLKGVVA
jgi:hypothetical protein